MIATIPYLDAIQQAITRDYFDEAPAGMSLREYSRIWCICKEEQFRTTWMQPHTQQEDGV